MLMFDIGHEAFSIEGVCLALSLGCTLFFCP